MILCRADPTEEAWERQQTKTSTCFEWWPYWQLCVYGQKLGKGNKPRQAHALNGGHIGSSVFMVRSLGKATNQDKHML